MNEFPVSYRRSTFWVLKMTVMKAVHILKTISSSSPARSKTWYRTITLVTLSLEEELTPELLVVFVEPIPEPVVRPVDLSSLQLDSDRLVWICRNNEILEVWIRRLNILLIRV